MENNWNDLSVTPPDKIVQVADKDGNIAKGQPTYYPFEIIKKEGDELKAWGWRGTPVFNSDGKSQWDGGWMISVGMETRRIGEVCKWREIK